MKKIIIAVCLVFAVVAFFAFNTNDKQQERADYDVVVNSSLAVLKSSVKDKLKAGWKVAGGIAVAANGNYYQAIYKQ